ncbi:MAG TPA: hypothetical protein VGP46_08250 [Acidimicrobiales bacterium]|jgi:hypothetical protein|nr:hypothetical protein [Acidimicrobiales bacterium]
MAGTVAHHGFELGSGVGLVFQPQLGLSRAAGAWLLQFGGWAFLSRRGQWAEPVLAALNGACLSGVLVHFILWPWRRGPGGLPLLREAEGLTARQLPAYNTILWFWATMAGGALVFETPRRARRWSLVGILTLPVFVVSARHHFEWVTEQALDRPSWWNRALRSAAHV